MKIILIEICFHHTTPLFLDHRRSTLLGSSIYLKMDCYQPAGSFKIRGIGRLCQEMAQAGVKGFLSSSGGNAGLAVAHAGKVLSLPTIIVVPSTTPNSVRERMKGLGAAVIEFGDVWDESDAYARGYAKEKNLAYIHPFDDPVIWAGHASIVDELVKQGPKPDIIICSVGGGGLLCGIMTGLVNNSWSDVRVVAVETVGAASLDAAVQAGELVTIPAITSIAKTLGAKRVAQRAFEWTQSHNIHNITVTDKQAIEACIQFADDFRVLVEPSCGAALAALPILEPVIQTVQNVVVVVCGGNGVNTSQIIEWKNGG